MPYSIAPVKSQFCTGMSTFVLRKNYKCFISQFEQALWPCYSIFPFASLRSSIFDLVNTHFCSFTLVFLSFSKATGSRLGTLIETSFGMILALVIAFVYSWVLTLLILTVIPFVAVSASLEVKALAGHTNKTRQALEKSGKVKSNHLKIAGFRH